jgi:hypothetical protein
MNVLGKANIGGAALSLALFAVVASPSFAQTPPPSGGTPTHEQVHQMLDDMHGAGTSQRMHEVMGPDADRMIDQLVAMQDMMQQMHAMMGDGGMAAMPDDQRQMMQDMMRDHHAMMQDMPRMMLQMMGLMSSGVMPMDVMRDHWVTMQGMMQQMMAMMQQMMGLMSSGTMTVDVMRDHHAMMQSMMQQMMAMMGGMQRGGQPDPAPAPAQIPRR